MFVIVYFQRGESEDRLSELNANQILKISMIREEISMLQCSTIAVKNM